ncbi:hypothetical protein SpCBS45565_g04517 [Spizellomyces sp. 'palustris']|nr:hypothetical protein SpCBS45565_g04517 [Spizellomyces sp. 'palustris']
MLALSVNSPLTVNTSPSSGERYMCPVKSCRQLFQYRETLAQHSRSRHNRTYEPIVLDSTQEAPAPQPRPARNGSTAPRRSTDLSSPDAAPIPRELGSLSEPGSDSSVQPRISTRSKKRKVDVPPPPSKRPKRGNDRKAVGEEPVHEESSELWKEIQQFDEHAKLMTKYEYWMNRYQRDLHDIMDRYKEMAANEPNPASIINPFENRIRELEVEGKALKSRIQRVAENVETGVLASLRSQLAEKERARREATEAGDD